VSATVNGRPAVFFDRDGTLIEEVSYLDAIERIRLFPYSVEAIRLLRRAGYAIVVVTNQAGVARGFFDEAFVESTHRHIGERFAQAGAPIDAFYYCPHYASGSRPEYAVDCACRKPAPGMVERAVEELGIDPRRSFVVGDRWLDVKLAQNVGAQGILVRTGYGTHSANYPEDDVRPAAVVDHVFAAASWIVRVASRRAGPSGPARRPSDPARILPLSELSPAIAEERRQGRTIALANGCFDILHVGHVRYLEASSEQADRLVVAVNADDTVRQLKGEGRPVLSAADRAELVAALRCVDYVVVFEEPTVTRVLEALHPDVHCKGTDYTVETVPERAVVAAYGGRTAIVGDPKNHSTRELLARIGAGPAGPEP
jgi:rfaE bifunctional protein nucleotidyltransferase chain/domain